MVTPKDSASPFTSVAEARELGAPTLRLHRAALGRDPDADGLLALVAARRRGATLPDLAADLAGTTEFAAMHGPGGAGTPADATFASRIAAQAFGPDGDTKAAVLGAAVEGLSRVEALLAVAEAGPVRARSPLLPGLFPDVPPDDPVAYAFWLALGEPAPPTGPSDARAVTLFMQAGDSESEAVLRTAQSLQAQSHARWRLVVMARLHSAWPRRALQALAEQEPRVSVVVEQPPLPDSPGGFVGWAMPGDTLAPHALQAMLAAADGDTMLVFSDEDLADHAGARSAPRFKPGFSAEAMLHHDAVGRLALFRADALADAMAGAGGKDAQAAPYDVARRVAALAGPARIRHVAAVLFHGAGPPPGPATQLAAHPAVLPPAMVPTVTVILPTRDRADLLAASSGGVLRGTDYPALDLLVVDHGSTEPAARALLAEIAADPRAAVMPWEGAFNFAAMNNAAARQARGAVLLLLNNDIEVIDLAWLRAMVAYAARPDVGAVGARLLYRDGRLQHGGMVLGPAGRATHVLRGAPRDAPGYGGQLAVPRDMSAVTAACLAIRAEVWAAVGGMDEGLPVAWNDVDLCQRVRAAGLRVIWTPHAVLLHGEGETRGEDALDAGRQARFLADGARYRATWGRAADEDPFLNPNLRATDHQLVLMQPRQG